jgi:hypothetical protein
MYLIYLDEAGNTGENLDDPHQPIYVMAAVIIRDRQWKSIEKYHDEFCDSACARYLPRSPKFEVHACEIFQGTGLFRSWSPEHRVALLKDSLNTFPSHKLPIIYGAIDKQNLRAQYSDPLAPHGLAFMLCVERIERWFRANAADDIGMLICDETKVKSEFKKSLRQYQTYGIPLGIEILRLDHIVDTVHFADSHESYGIQLADTANYFIKRYLERKKNAEEYFKLIGPQIWSFTRFP